MQELIGRVKRLCHLVDQISSARIPSRMAIVQKKGTESHIVAEAKANIEDQIDKLGGYIDRLYALGNNDAVNRLAMLSVVLGIGALVTGYYGMNVKHLLTFLDNAVGSAVTLALVTIFVLASLWLVIYIVASNWRDYRASIFPHRYRRPLEAKSLRRAKT